jgi:D-alanyl-lipoteichoic acid acyltransferase DltB (MBOAT superfamily)
VTGYLTSHTPGAGGKAAFQLEAFLHGYRVAFVVGGFLLAAALVVVIIAINAKRDNLPAPQDAEAVPATV